MPKQPKRYFYEIAHDIERFEKLVLKRFDKLLKEYTIKVPDQVVTSPESGKSKQGGNSKLFTKKQ